jgi:hypothetical protein
MVTEPLATRTTGPHPKPIMATTQPNGSPPKYELYYNPFSICSLMVLYTLRLKGQPKSPADEVEPEECLIDIYAGEQMTEKYLEIHPKGTVRINLTPLS